MVQTQNDNSISLLDRQTLIATCLATVQSIDLWQNRYQVEQQQRVGSACALLRAGCEYQLGATADAIVVTILFEGFTKCEPGGGDDNLEALEVTLPTANTHPVASPVSSEMIDSGSDTTRNQLIKLCDLAIVPQDRWGNRDSASAQQNVGAAWAMLQAGCDYRIRRTPEDASCITTDHTFWIELYDRNGSSFTAYLPTLETLKTYGGQDWY